jgi:hypothetical protein
LLQFFNGASKQVRSDSSQLSLGPADSTAEGLI